MQPSIKMNINDIIAETKFMENLSKIMFGAELALKYANASDMQAKEIQERILRSVFQSLDLDYNAMHVSAGSPSKLRMYHDTARTYDARLDDDEDLD